MTKRVHKPSHRFLEEERCQTVRVERAAKNPIASRTSASAVDYIRNTCCKDLNNVVCRGAKGSRPDTPRALLTQLPETCRPYY
ncbi:hypothetical protein J6590_033206 [Homalodisca vitripennis]|nr:hypothetical protein J6590_033206 [Homalodisca vitripennis]